MKTLTLAVAAALVALPYSTSSATPSEGVELRVRRGFFTDTNVGAFFTLGGQDRYSNAQTYLQLGVGYDISQHVELSLIGGIGASAANCFGVRNGDACVSSDLQSNGKAYELTDNFTIGFVNLTVAYLVQLGGRFYLTPKLAAGYTLLDPAPVRVADRFVTTAPNLGAGLGVEYVTAMDHFSVGAEVLGRLIVGPNIPTIAIFPRVKYTF